MKSMWNHVVLSLVRMKQYVTIPLQGMLVTVPLDSLAPTVELISMSAFQDPVKMEARAQICQT